MKSFKANKAHFAQKCMKTYRQFIPTIAPVRIVGINHSLYAAWKMYNIMYENNLSWKMLTVLLG